MKICLVSLNYSPELTGIGKYNGEMCNYFVEKGHTFSIYTAPPYYPEWKIHQGYKCWKYTKELKDNIVIWRCPTFVPKKLSFFYRIAHLLSFSLSSFLLLIFQFFKKNDVLILIQPTLFCTPFILFYCKLTKTKSVLHIQDFEIDAMFSLGIAKEKKYYKLILGLESWLISKFDMVSTISYKMLDIAKSKGVDSSKLVFFPNWADINFITPEVNGSELKKHFGFLKMDKIILYSGNIGKKQDLGLILTAAEYFKASTIIKFVIVGTGAFAQELKKIAFEKALHNIIFMPLQTWDKVPEMLAMADIHLVLQKKGVADAVLPSKLTNILSVGGHAIVTAEKNSELGRLEQMFTGIYKRLEPGNEKDFIASLVELLGKDLSKHNEIARKYAEEFLDKDTILNRFEQDLFRLVN